MRKMTVYAVMLLVLGAAVWVSAAEEKGMEPKKASPKDLAPQTMCPVMGGEIDSTIFADYQGQRVFFCCAACVDMFLKDPEASFKKAAEQNVMYMNVQKACPVCGEPVDREHFRYYMGRGLFFSSAECAAEFDKRPGEYLEKMKGEGHGDKGHEHEGHGHVH